MDIDRLMPRPLLLREAELHAFYVVVPPSDEAKPISCYFRSDTLLVHEHHVSIEFVLK